MHERSMGPAMRSCSQFDLLIMDCSQSPYNHSEPGFPLQEYFLSNTHMHMFTRTKAVQLAAVAEPLLFV